MAKTNRSLCSLLILACCAILLVNAPALAAGSSADLVAELQKLLNAEVSAHPSLPGELLHVYAPKQNVDVSLAAGLFDRETKQPLDPHDVFRVASVTKTFVAASILRLYEDGKIKLDGPVNQYLPDNYNSILEAGGYTTKTITVRQLLTHTSGIFDYAHAEQYFQIVISDPKHRWTRLEQLQGAMKWGNPYGNPGRVYHYADTNYILLGEMLEQLTGKPFAAAMRSILNFKKLKLDETYLETLEPRPPKAKELSHPYFLQIDARDFDPSVDLYGGGGLVSSVQDLALFYRALVRGRVFKRPSTLQLMLTVPATNAHAPGGPYAMGIQRRDIAGNICWGHTGFWGTSVFHCPDADVTIVRHYNQAQPAPDFIFQTLFDQIATVLHITKR